MNRSNTYTNILFYLLCLFFISACGGGGGGSANIDDGDKKSLTSQTLEYITHNDITLTVGEELANSVTGQGSGEITYTSSDESIVTVSSEGTLSALAQGTATITATITEDENYSAASATIEITVNALVANTAPTINSFSSNLDTVVVSNPVQFNWNISDADSDTLNCQLDINDDGSTDYTIENCTSGNVQNYTYTTPGSYTAKLTVNDNNGGTTEHTTTVTVKTKVIQVNRAPVISSFTATAISDMSIKFSWNISDADSDTLACSLDINNDGSADYTIENCTSNSVQNHNFLEFGDFTAKLIVTDTKKASVFATQTLSIVDITAPIITLTGQASITLLQDTDYQEPGATATDNIDPEITVIITGTVDNTTVGDYTITYSATDQAGNTSTVTRTITIREPKPFITTWKTDNEGTITGQNSIYIGTTENDYNYNYNVDWGDESISENITGNISHTYAAPGTYTVSISGTFPRIIFSRSDHDHSKLLSIEQWGDIQWQSMNQAFAYCENLVSNATDTPDLSQVTDLSYMFRNATSFNQDINNWNVSSVINMSHMFYYANSFNQDISKWDTSSVKYMDYMFYFVQDFNQDISNWDVTSVTDMHSMFSWAKAFNQDISNWDVSSVINMAGMFDTATSFNQDINTWDVSSVTNMNQMFYRTSFNQNLNGWDTSSVLNSGGMFAFNSKFNQDINDWDMSSVTNTYQMFYKAYSFNQDLSSWDMSEVTNMKQMFNRATSFNQDLGQWDVSSVSDMENMFDGVTLSTANYDALLNGWSARALQEDVNFNGGNSIYSSSSQGARNILISNYNWTIADGGLVPSDL